MKKAFWNVLLLFCITLSILNCSKNPGEIYPENSVYPGYFEKIWTDYDENYSYFIHKNIDWNDIKNQYESLVTSQITYEDFIDNIISGMLTELKDLHVNLYDKNGQPVLLYSIDVTDNYRYDDTFFDTYIEGESYTSNSMICLGRVSDSLGYMKIRTWNSNFENDVAELHQIFDTCQSYYSGYKGLII